MPRERIRQGRRDDLDTLREIERSAGAIFAEIGMSAVAEDEPPSIGTLAKYCDDARLWVAVDELDHPIAYLIADLIDDLAHVAQVSVHADHSGKRIGRALIEALTAWARRRGLTGVTLTTFSEVPWNAPYYARLGFDVVSESDLSPGLGKIRLEERALGLDRWPRVCMRRDVGERPGEPGGACGDDDG